MRMICDDGSVCVDPCNLDNKMRCAFVSLHWSHCHKCYGTDEIILFQLFSLRLIEIIQKPTRSYQIWRCDNSSKISRNKPSQAANVTSVSRAKHHVDGSNINVRFNIQPNVSAAIMLENKWASHNPLIHDSKDDMRLILTRYDCFKRTNRITTDYIRLVQWTIAEYYSNFKCSNIIAALCHLRMTWESICIKILSRVHFPFFNGFSFSHKFHLFWTFSSIFSTYWTR